VSTIFALAGELVPVGLPTTAPAATEGLQVTTAPWPPEYGSLAPRLVALHLPAQSDIGFHIHARLRVFVDGRAEVVPANLGIDPEGRFLAPIHTHDTSGIVHLEAARPYPFTLGQLFAIWGVKFAGDDIGAYRDAGPNRLRVYVDGRRVRNPVSYVIRRHDRIVVGYGRPGSFPTRVPGDFPPGL
jgi:hypothetical protein